jgi:hypothetical protein
MIARWRGNSNSSIALVSYLVRRWDELYEIFQRNPSSKNHRVRVDALSIAIFSILCPVRAAGEAQEKIFLR